MQCYTVCAEAGTTHHDLILGSSIMAIFGKLAWPAIVMLVVFTAIFFGAGKLHG